MTHQVFTADSLPAAEDHAAHWMGVFAMTLCVFALIASEFMPVSLLTPIANDLQVSEGMAGYGIAISGAFAVPASLLIARLAGSLDRKLVLLGLTSLMCVSGLVVGLAPNYATYMVGRALIGIVIGGFWSLSAAVAMRLVPAHLLSRALAIFNSGNAMATVVAPPLGSFLGSIVGWRGAFLSLVPIALIALVWQWLSLPKMPALRRATDAVQVFRLLRNPFLALGFAAVGIFFMGQFMLFTYLRPFLENVVRVNISTLSMLLLMNGIAGFIGTTVIGAFLKMGLYRTLVTIPIVMAVVGIALTHYVSSVMGTAGLIGVWGLFATAAPVGWWLWLSRALPNDAEAGGGLMVAVIQLSIAVGASVGGAVFDGSGYQVAFGLSAVLLTLSSVATFLTARRGATGKPDVARTSL